MFNGELKTDNGQKYILRLKCVGYPSADDVEKNKFNEYYDKCLSNKEYRNKVKKCKFNNFDRYCCIVAGIRTAKYFGFSRNDAYNINIFWDVTDYEYEMLKEILPDDVKPWTTIKS